MLTYGAGLVSCRANTGRVMVLGPGGFDVRPSLAWDLRHWAIMRDESVVGTISAQPTREARGYAADLNQGRW